MSGVEIFGLSGGPLAAAAFVTLSVLLLIHAGINRARRHRGLARSMPELGFQVIDEPDPATLVPDELFYPNGFASQDKEGGYGSVLPRVPVAWSGSVAGRETVVMEVSITRTHPVKTSKSINRTVIRWAPSGAEPPDFMIHEWPLLKGQIRGARAISGPAEIGKHYYLFSDAPDEALVPWITQTLRDQLERHRLWTLAAHDGVFYLSRNTSKQRPNDMPEFLTEAGDLLGGLPAEARSD